MFLARLKQETLPQHTAVERQVDLKRVCQSPEAYAGHLARMYGFYQPLEEALWRTRAVQNAGLGEERRKTPLLVRDLDALGVEVSLLPRCSVFAPLVGEGQALGCFYVLEGATLGGQVITRVVRERLGIMPETGGAFFYGYGERTGAMWDRFRAVLEASAPDAAAQDAVIAAAQATFGALGDWLAVGKENP